MPKYNSFEFIEHVQQIIRYVLNVNVLLNHYILNQIKSTNKVFYAKLKYFHKFPMTFCEQNIFYGGNFFDPATATVMHVHLVNHTWDLEFTVLKLGK